MNYNIKNATENDIDLFFSFFEKSILTEFPEYTESTRKYFVEQGYSKEALQKGLREKQFTLFLATVDNNTVGFLLTTKAYGGIA
jgi:hypothetical protein